MAKNPIVCKFLINNKKSPFYYPKKDSKTVISKYFNLLEFDFINHLFS